MLDPYGPVTAGSMMEWTLTYTAGSYGVDEGGTIMVVQRMATDMQSPQFDHPDQPAFTTITTTADCHLSYRFQRKQYQRPWQKWCLVIDVQDGYIQPGDRVAIIFGDRSKGSPGIRAQTFVESAHEFRVLVDPTNAALMQRLPSSPKLPVVAGEPVKLVCIVPSQLKVGEHAEVFVKGEDAWGNPTPPPVDLQMTLDGDGGAIIEDGTLKAFSPGTLNIEVRIGELICRSNPVQITDARTRYCKFWGDLHGQTDSTVGTGTEEEYFIFARKKARLDFVSHQGNDFQVSDEDWKRLNRVIKKHHRPGEFVIFSGFEWSGNTCAGGDHNVIYLKDDQPIFRSSHWQIPEVPEDELSPAHPVDQLFDRLKKNGNAMVIAHVGGRYADVRNYFDPEIEHLVEILSCHGVFEWLLWDALEQDHKVGVVCNSDGHKGRPGAEGPGVGQFGIFGGLTCVLAEELTRESIFNALKARRCYGTTGARISLWMEANGRIMGEEFKANGSVKIRTGVIGTAPVEALILMRGREIIHKVRPTAFETVRSSRRIRVSWEGARIRGRTRRAVWNGEIRVEGPHILEARTFAFDSSADGIVEQNAHKVIFRSSTTGDMDGIDLVLNQAKEGRISFQSGQGNIQMDLSQLEDEICTYKFGGLGLMVKIQRYPEQLQATSLDLVREIQLIPNSVNPLLVKAIQEDGHIAWSSPIFITSYE